METVIITIGLMGVLVLIMAVGVIFGRNPLKGSCGGSGGCDVCSSGSCSKDDGPESGS